MELDRGTGALGSPALAAEAPNPTFLAPSPDGRFLYAVCACDGWASSFRVDPSSPGLTPVQQPPRAADRRRATSPWTPPAASRSPPTTTWASPPRSRSAPTGRSGRRGSSRTRAGDPIPPARPRRTCIPPTSPRTAASRSCATSAWTGSTPTPIDRGAVALRPGIPPFVAAAPGAGPRHFAFGADGRRGYAINELDNTIVAYDYAAPDGGLIPRGAVSVLPAGHAGEATAAEVRLHPNGRFVYGSSRGPDTIAVFAADRATGALSAVEVVPVRREGPEELFLLPGRRVARVRPPGLRHPLRLSRGRPDGPPGACPRDRVRVDAGVRPVPRVSAAPAALREASGRSRSRPGRRPG